MEGDYYVCVRRQNPDVSPNSSLSFTDVQSDIKTQASPPPLKLPAALDRALTFFTPLPVPLGATLHGELQPFHALCPPRVLFLGPSPQPGHSWSPFSFLVILQFSAERQIGWASHHRLCWHMLCQYFLFSGFCARLDCMLCEGGLGAASVLFVAVFPWLLGGKGTQSTAGGPFPAHASLLGVGEVLLKTILNCCRTQSSTQTCRKREFSERIGHLTG